MYHITTTIYGILTATILATINYTTKFHSKHLKCEGSDVLVPKC